MPIWSDPTLGSPRDPWVHPHDEAETFNRSVGGNNNNNASRNQSLDSAEIREESPGAYDPQLESGEPITKKGQLDDPNLQDVAGTSKTGEGAAGSSSPLPVLDDDSSQGENVKDRQTPEQGLSSPMAKDVIEQTQQTTNRFQICESNQEVAGINVEEAANEVNGVLNAVSDVLGPVGIKYSHIQHTDLCKIEMELHELGLNQAHNALLQGIRTQGILYRRIEACSAVEEQEVQAGRLANYPKNLHPYNPKEMEELYSQWALPSFRFGIEFPDVKNIAPQTEQISEAHFYAGSIWKVRLLIDDVQNEVRLHLFRNQRKVGRIGGVQTPYDSREVVCTRFKFLVPSKDGMAARSSRPGRFQQKKGRGWNDFLRLDNIEKYLTPWGSLRVIVVVYAPFESD